MIPIQDILLQELNLNRNWSIELNFRLSSLNVSDYQVIFILLDSFILVFVCKTKSIFF